MTEHRDHRFFGIDQFLKKSEFSFFAGIHNNGLQ
jgi:hypothetical protein